MTKAKPENQFSEQKLSSKQEQDLKTEKQSSKKPLSTNDSDEFVEKSDEKKKSPLKFFKKGQASQSLKEKMRKTNTDKEPSIEEKLKLALEDNLYLRAEFENFKKRIFEEKARLIRYGGESFISSLADGVLDDIERAMQSAQRDNSFEDLKKGLELIQKKLSQVLKDFGVEVLDPTGKAFDPSYQEALSHIKTSKVPEGYVAETFKKAYKFHDKIIRPAQVVLAKKED